MKTWYTHFLLVIISACSKQKPAAEPAIILPTGITYAGHIAPLVKAKCVTCHKANGVAPFSLERFQDVAKRAEDIKEVTGERVMPPWKADHTYVSFKNERHLKEYEIKLLHAWIDQGMKHGDAKANKDSVERRNVVRKPDIVLKMEKPNIIEGDNKEYFLLNYIPFELTEDRYVKEIEFVGGNKKLLHHCTYYFYDVNDKNLLKGDNGPFNVDVSEKHTEEVKERYKLLTRNLSFFAGWIPGAGPVVFPKGIGFKMPKQGMLMLTMHYASSPVDTDDLSYLNVYFHDNKPERIAKNVTMGTGGLGRILPPIVLEPEMLSNHKVTVPVNTDVSAISVWPHMHLLGKKFKAYAISPNYDTIRLVKINDWDFKWQEIYYFKQIVKIPRGSTIFIEATFDNTSDNYNNPFVPPRRVVSKGNMATTDEMLTMMIMYLDYQRGDEGKAL